jgi:uncharacterized cupredoxin-like copper-binding protein
MLATGCGADERAADAARTVRVTERDFRIKVSPRVVSAGQLRFAVDNKGPVSHELLIVRANAALLPLRGDGITVDEDAVEHNTAGVLEPGAPGQTRQLTVNLRPGRYELICNMFGHYLGGMRTPLVVE